MASNKIDPRLYAPIVEGLEYEDTSADFVEQATDGTSVELPIPVTSSGLQPPETITVVDQIFRKGPDGKVVVDLIIEVEAVPGAETYEVRTAVG